MAKALVFCNDCCSVNPPCVSASSLLQLASGVATPDVNLPRIENLQQLPEQLAEPGRKAAACLCLLAYACVRM